MKDITDKKLANTKQKTIKRVPKPTDRITNLVKGNNKAEDAFGRRVWAVFNKIKNGNLYFNLNSVLETYSYIDTEWSDESVYEDMILREMEIEKIISNFHYDTLSNTSTFKLVQPKFDKLYCKYENNFDQESIIKQSTKDLEIKLQDTSPVKVIRETESIATNFTKGFKNDDKKPYFDLPQGTKWEDITIKFVDRHNVKIIFKGKSFPGDYKEMGFEDSKSHKPNMQWEFLLLLADNHGQWSWDNAPSKNIDDIILRGHDFVKVSDDNGSTFQNIGYSLIKSPDNRKKIKQLLSRALKIIFQIETDPFYVYRKVKAYKIKINLIP